MATWFDTLPPALADAAGAEADRFGLWMRLAQLHLDTLPDIYGVDGETGSALWRERYETGWSPRQAAFAAWNAGPPPQAVEATVHAGPMHSTATQPGAR
ncbi:MAG: hypothetical protein ACYC1D_04735 [Acidimicrobiales bacterium]